MIGKLFVYNSHCESIFLIVGDDSSNEILQNVLERTMSYVSVLSIRPVVIELLQVITKRDQFRMPAVGKNAIALL